MATSTDTRRVVSHEGVVRGGCRYFIRHGTIDMDSLAISLAISRATLYRVVHSRDRLLGDVLWNLAEHELTAARAARTRSGVDGIVEVTQRFCARLLHSAPYRTFLSAEPQTAARVLFTQAGGVHARVVAAQKDIMLECADESQPWRTGDLDSLAYLYVRIVESMLYAELLTGRPPDPHLTERAVRSLFQVA